MNWKTWVPLALAIVLGVVAAKVARDMVKQNRPAPTQTVKLSKVIVAKADIMPGHEIKAEDLADAQVSTENVPAGSFNDVQQLVGRVAEMRMVKSQPVLEASLAPQGAGAGLQALIPKGMRAITMEVNEFSGVAGLLAPGCRVDVMATIQGDGKQMARTIVQNVKVTAVGQRMVMAAKEGPEDKSAGAPPEITRSVTLLASLKEAEAIELATSTGRPRLVLRSTRDEDVAKSEGITVGELCGNKESSGGFWANALKAIGSAKPSTQPSNAQQQTAVAAAPATQPSIPKHIVRIFRAGSESSVSLEFDKKSTAEASGQSEVKEATGH
ncbi:MAG TPA: Flp pilus assembly protein CpaB [Tepidisphaeraceae bacterium]|jgi:pilus assembly protein CpaB